jgi:hypothetical protein
MCASYRLRRRAIRRDQESQVRLNHSAHQIFKTDPWMPFQASASLGRITLKQLDLGRAQEDRVFNDVFGPIEP